METLSTMSHFDWIGPLQRSRHIGNPVGTNRWNVPKGLRAALMTRRCLILVAVCVTLSLSRNTIAEEVQQLAQSKDWELVKVEDPFLEKSVQCQIRTRTAQPGGRRERPLMIFDLTSERIVVRPDLALQGSVEANRALQGGMGDRGGRHQVVVRHGIRVDRGKLYTVELRDTGSGTLEARFGPEVYAALAHEVRGGTTLFYLWAVESSRKSFEFPVDGLRELFPTARQECAALSGR